jgi:hypothetical protein
LSPKTDDTIERRVAALEAAQKEAAQRVSAAPGLPAPGLLAPTGGIQNINITPGPVINNFVTHTWDSKERLVISLDLLKAAFRENEMLREYCTLPEVNRTDPEFVNAYVLEALMAVIRQAHRSPGSQNIRPNPSRADQVQVLVREGGERWEILTLAEAVSLLFRDAASRMIRLAESGTALQTLTPAEQSASFLMPTAYRRCPEKYEREGKGRLAAHLATLEARRAEQAAPPAGALPALPSSAGQALGPGAPAPLAAAHPGCRG